METLLLILMGGLSLLTVSLQRTYADVGLTELKRRARDGDEIAGGLVKAVAYGHSLRAVLWFLIGTSSAAFFVVVGQRAPLWFALSASALLIWLGFVWIPATRVSYLSRRIAAFLAPAFAKLLSYIGPIIDSVVRFIRRYRPVRLHTGLYDRYDLIDMLERQQVQPDNRVEKAELEIAKHALQFGHIKIRERMIPRRQIRMVSVHDAMGPIIMDELHASGHSRFPVFDGKQDNIVGTLYLHDLVHVKKSSTVRSIMKPEVYYLHEDQTLHDALQAVLKTHHHLFMVVNEFEELTGIISSEDVFEAIVGQPIKDEFDAYHDIRAVATKEAKADHQERKEEKAEPVADESEQLLAEAEAEPDESEEEIDTIELDNTKD